MVKLKAVGPWLPPLGDVSLYVSVWTEATPGLSSSFIIRKLPLAFGGIPHAQTKPWIQNDSDIFWSNAGGYPRALLVTCGSQLDGGPEHQVLLTNRWPSCHIVTAPKKHAYTATICNQRLETVNHHRTYPLAGVATCCKGAYWTVPSKSSATAETQCRSLVFPGFSRLGNVSTLIFTVFPMRL